MWRGSGEAAGAEVEVMRGDVSEEGEMREVVRRVEERYGELHGVLHAAGVTSGTSVFNPITEIRKSDVELQFQPKVYGLYVLERVLEGRELDFCLLFSSNASILGGLGFVAYAASNGFMDAFAIHQRKASDTYWVSATWDHWPEETKQYTGFQTSMDQYTMTRDESVEAFRRAVTMTTEPHLIVSTGDLHERLSVWINRDFLDQESAGEKQVASYPRPDVQSNFVAPRNETEQVIANEWKQILGIEQVGINDNFFELGGHSLLATKLIARLRNTFNVDLPLTKFFESPTVTGMAQAVSSMQETTEDDESLEVLERLAGLSEEEAEAELNKRTNPD
ncbi:MAG: SDR family oxidoreductase [Acidobacteria bacterium]|nr:SDR family oxidoreductase [Acidobacteriota bacterium]